MNLRTIAVLIACGTSASTQAQLRPRDRFAITTEQVAAKLMATFAQDGVALDAKQVVLPEGVTSSEETPVLEVRSIEQLHGGEGTNSAIKLACKNVGVCLPFYVMVNWPGGDQSLMGLKKPQLLGLGNAVPVIKYGAHVTLFMERGRPTYK